MLWHWLKYLNQLLPFSQITLVIFLLIFTRTGIHMPSCGLPLPFNLFPEGLYLKLYHNSLLLKAHGLQIILFAHNRSPFLLWRAKIVMYSIWGEIKQMTDYYFSENDSSKILVL